jgi:hypothetical protein
MSTTTKVIKGTKEWAVQVAADAANRFAAGDQSAKWESAEAIGVARRLGATDTEIGLAARDRRHSNDET